MPGATWRGSGGTSEEAARERNQFPGKHHGGLTGDRAWALGAPALSHPYLGLDPRASRLKSATLAMWPTDAPYSTLGLSFSVPICTLGRHSPAQPSGCSRSRGGSRLCSTHPRPTAATVWEKEGLKIKHCKYPCFLQIEPAPESPWPPRQPGPDSSFEGGGGQRVGVSACAPVPSCCVSQPVRQGVCHRLSRG